MDVTRAARTPPVPGPGTIRATVAALAVLVSLAPVPSASTPAPGTLAWQRREAGAGPRPRMDHAMAYDEGRRRVIVFGGRNLSRYALGQDPSANPMGDLWEWDGQSWVRLVGTVPQQGTPDRTAHHTQPAPRFGAAMAYDPVRGRTVLYGGIARLLYEAQQNWYVESNEYMRDTWEWDGLRWTQFNVSSPPYRAFHSMTYDPVRGRVVMFGGTGPGGLSYYDDLYEWDGTRWYRVNPRPSPLARGSHTLVSDAARGTLVLFGGTVGSVDMAERLGVGIADTWTLSASRVWSLRVPDAAPLPRGHFAAASGWGNVFVHGGRPVPFLLLDDLWEWDGTTWHERSVPGGPNYRDGHAMVFDPVDDRFVMFGGCAIDACPNDELWELSRS